MCRRIIGLDSDAGIEGGKQAFDIIELAYPSLAAAAGRTYDPPDMNYGKGACWPTVAFNQRAYFSHAVNYSMWGKIMKLASEFMKDQADAYSLDAALFIAAAHKATQPRPEFPGSSNVDQALAFTKYGYNGTSPQNVALPCYVDPKNRSKSTSGFNWVWEPGKPRQATYPGYK